VAEQMGKAKSTIWNWLIRFDKKSELHRKPRADRNKSRFFQSHPTPASSSKPSGSMKD
jgi:transposase